MKTQNYKAALACIILFIAPFFLIPVTASAKENRNTNSTKGSRNWAPDKQLVLNLYGLFTGNVESLADGLRVRYNDGYLSSTADDIVKMMNFGENISSYRENRDLVIERRPLIIATDTIYLHFTNANIHDYRFKINTVNFESSGLIAYLQDSYTGSSGIINLDGSINNIDFTVSNDPATASPFRFRIVFGVPAALPVTISSFKASCQGKQVVLNWQLSNQLNMQQYEVERSTDGIHFTSKNIQPVTGNNGGSASYNWIDNYPATGNNFYRIRCVGIGGDITNSPVINVKTGSGIGDISIYPNPVINNTIALQFTDMAKGVYQLRLLGSSGEVVFTKAINHTGSNSAQTVLLGSGIARGNYYLEISGPGDLKITKGVSVE